MGGSELEHANSNTRTCTSVYNLYKSARTRTHELVQVYPHQNVHEQGNRLILHVVCVCLCAHTRVCVCVCTGE
jgi:hypothetical protein